MKHTAIYYHVITNEQKTRVFFVSLSDYRQQEALSMLSTLSKALLLHSMPYSISEI